MWGGGSQTSSGETNSLINKNNTRAPSFVDKARFNDDHRGVKRGFRRPTDLLILLLFIAFWAGMIAIAIKAFKDGDPNKLYKPNDYLGRTCGYDNSNAPDGSIALPSDPACMQNPGSAACVQAVNALGLKQDLSKQKYLWYMDLLHPIEYGGVCVSYCPGSNPEAGNFCPPELQTETVAYVAGEKLTYCSYTRVDNNQTFPSSTEAELIQGQLEYESVLLRCIPSVIVDNINHSDAIKNQLNSASASATRAWGDLARSWKVILASVGVALVLAFTFMILLRLFAGVMVWLTVGFCFVVLVALGAACIGEGYAQKNGLQKQEISTSTATALIYVGAAVLVLSVIYVVVVLFLVKKIRRAVGILKESCNALATMPQTLFFPPIVSLFIAGFLAYWIVVSLWLWSTGGTQVNQNQVQVNWDNTLRGMFAYHLFGLLWTSQVFVAYIYTTVAGAVGIWYWTRSKTKAIFGLPLTRSALTVFVFHLGSLAFGSLIVAIAQLIRIVVRIAQRKAEMATLNNPCVKGINWYISCCLACMEKFIKFVNKNAYIQVSLYGCSFISGARNAFSLIARNAVQMAVVEWISDVLLFLCKLVVAGLTCTIAILLTKIPWMVNDSHTVPQQTPILVGFIALFIGYLIASLFVTIFETTIDTILQCFLIDKEMCEDNPAAVPFCTDSLAKLISHNTKLNEESSSSRGCCCC